MDSEILVAESGNQAFFHAGAKNSKNRKYSWKRFNVLKR
ncbi:hypothetical protein B4135_2913 [Caldibacillus debilis]|uniref:Uncharacterized protein n=1 Tax=Caldibacillus debilis TaxID=301148 RepID=A0A150LM16_9BACI|nr:hypothetical protein B4135_2913 [Caldibacillus debilis]